VFDLQITDQFNIPWREDMGAGLEVSEESSAITARKLAVIQDY